MKRYVFITPSLSNMGGAQLYIRNKMLYLRKKGWDVLIISGRSKNIIIPELKVYQSCIPELSHSTYFFSNLCQKRVINKLLIMVSAPKYKEVLIESHTLETSTWAESLAGMTNARHLVFLLPELNVVYNKGMQNFLLFKHHRQELAGISKKSLYDLFLTFHPIEISDSYQLSTFCSNPEADVDSPLIIMLENERYDYLIGALSRMDKPFVIHAVQDVCDYALSHEDKQFLFLWIGDAFKGSPIPDEVKRITSKVHNVKLLITGYLYPVPTRLLEKCDVFISSAGSCWLCMRSGVPTISYDTSDFQPIGVLGRTTQNSTFRGDDEPPQMLSKLLEEILIEKKYTKQPSNYHTELPDFKSHFDFINDNEVCISHFNIDTIHIESISEFKQALLLRIFGTKTYVWFIKLKILLKQKLFNKL